MRELQVPYFVSKVEYGRAIEWLQNVARPAAISAQRSLLDRLLKAKGGPIIGEEYSFVITPTGIGPAVEVTYRAKGLKEMRFNVTDYSTW